MKKHYWTPWWTWFLGVVLAVSLTACGLGQPVNPGPPKPPEPTPTPTPPEPGPGPQPTPPNPGPTPPAPAGTLTPTQYDAVTRGMTTDQLIAIVGTTTVKTPYPSGVIAWVYPALDEHGVLLDAEFWVFNGKVVNKNRL